MKAQVAEKLIVMGAMLILAPIVAGYLTQRHVVELMKTTSYPNVTLDSGMSTDYRTGCFVAGAVMIGVAILRSWSGDRPENPQ